VFKRFKQHCQAAAEGFFRQRAFTGQYVREKGCVRFAL
jgi:hypothetical protein